MMSQERLERFVASWKWFPSHPDHVVEYKNRKRFKFKHHRGSWIVNS